MPDLKTITLKVTPEMDDMLSRLAAKKHTTKSDVIRQLIEMSVEKQLAQESVDFTREQIYDEIRAVCLPQFDRLAKLILKTGYESVSNFYLLAYIMDQILPPGKQKAFEEIKHRSKSMAVKYLKLSKEEFVDFIRSEAQALEDMDTK